MTVETLHLLKPCVINTVQIYFLQPQSPSSQNFLSLSSWCMWLECGLIKTFINNNVAFSGCSSDYSPILLLSAWSWGQMRLLKSVSLLRGRHSPLLPLGTKDQKSLCKPIKTKRPSPYGPESNLIEVNGRFLIGSKGCWIKPLNTKWYCFIFSLQLSRVTKGLSLFQLRVM